MPDENELGYGDAAQAYWDKGWRGVLPLRRGTKWPPPGGFTGYDGVDPSYPDIMQWSELYPQGNVCLRLPDGVIGIDVDAYGVKTGAAAFAEAVRRWGPLPDGPQSSSRDDDLTSGLRLFRVPPGTLLETVIVFPELSIGDIEIIQRHHRYAVCWPSIHPEGRGYWWRNSSGQLLGIPEIGELPELPQTWIDGLRLTPRSLELSGDGFDVRQALTAGDPSVVVGARLQMALKELNLPGTSRHDTCLRHVMALLRHGAEGQPGVEQALTLLREVFVAVVSMPGDGQRTRDEAVSEFNRMITNNNVARELSQPGINDWFKRSLAAQGVAERNTPPADSDPDAQNANVYRAENAGATDPATDRAAATGPPDPNPGSELEVLEEDFWTARPAHALVFDAALSRMVSPWAVFGCCVARALALVPPAIVLPATTGDIGSLNWFAAIVGRSGSGKGSAARVARRLIPDDGVNEQSVGSGEGMVERYNRGPKKDEDADPPVVSVMFDISEVSTLAAMGARSGQTTLDILKQGFSGERLGYSYKGSKNLVPDNTYRMTLIVGVQPIAAGVLLDDLTGTAQRFMWFPATDARIGRNGPPWPVDNLGGRLTLSANFPRFWEMAGAVGEVSIPPEAEDLIVDTRINGNRPEEDVLDALDSHSVFAREKLAFALAFMDGRLEINSEDWRLSGIAAAVSDYTRDATAEKLRESRVGESWDRGHLKGIENAAAELGKAKEQVEAGPRVAARVIDRVKRSMPEGITNRNLDRALGRDRVHMKAVLEYLVEQGTLTEVDGRWFAQ